MKKYKQLTGEQRYQIYALKKVGLSQGAIEVETIAFRHAKQQITAPVDGYIGKLLVRTVGGVVIPTNTTLKVEGKYT